MKISVVTFQRSTSYGAVMQSWALSRVLSKAGHTVELVDYSPAHRRSKAFPINIRRPYSRSNLWAVPLYLKFSRFIAKNCAISRRSFRTIEELRQFNWDSDAFIVGSDQIWNPDHTGGSFDPGYFAAFAPPSARRLSYAASMGTGFVDTKHHEAFRGLTQNLDFLSLREKVSAVAAQSLLGRECYHVLDPTLLGADYAAIEQPADVVANYVLSFPLQLTDTFNSIAVTASKQLALPSLAVAVSRSALYKAFDYSFQPNPGQWLWLIRNAKFVITNSFHGVVFCIIYNKPFVAVALEGNVASRTARIRDLLEQLGLGGRLVDASDQEQIASLVQSEVDWGDISERLGRLRTASLSYLDRALGGAGLLH